MSISQAERQRRKNNEERWVAEYAKGDRLFKDLIKDWGVGRRWAQDMLHRNGVKRGRGRPSTSEVYAQRILEDPLASQTEWAKRLGVTRQRIQQIFSRENLYEVIDQIQLDMAEDWLALAQDCKQGFDYFVGRYDLDPTLVRRLDKKFKLGILKTLQKNKVRELSYTYIDGELYASCSLCGEWKQKDEFHRGNRQGVSTRCKPCARRNTSDYYNKLPPLDEPLVKEKNCSACWQTKPAAEFARQTRSRDGLQTYCSECLHQLWNGGSVSDIRKQLGLPPGRIRRVKAWPINTS